MLRDENEVVVDRVPGKEWGMAQREGRSGPVRTDLVPQDRQSLAMLADGRGLCLATASPSPPLATSAFCRTGNVA